MLNLFFMLRLFFHFFPRRRGFEKRRKRGGWVVGAVQRECDDFILFRSLLLRCQAFVSKNCYFLRTFFPEKKIYGAFFITSTLSSPISQPESFSTASSHATLYLFLFSSLFFSVEMKKSIFSFFLAFYI